MLIAQWEIPGSEWPAELSRQPLWTLGYNPVVAIEPERKVQLIRHTGQRKAGTLPKYSLFRDFHNSPDSTSKWCHRFRAVSNGEAVEHAKRYLEKNWKD